MFSYYGSKSKIVKKYPKPLYGKIREPFAGSARYSLRYFENDVLLIDKYDVVVGIWKYLQQCSPKDILSLLSLKLKVGDKIDREDFDCIEQSWLVGFIIANGVSFPMLTVSPWGAVVMEKQIRDIAAQLYKIRHWEIKQGAYEDLPNEVATTFIDAPYQFGGDKYKFGNKTLDYDRLRDWVMSLDGHVIVTENTKATWMDFKPVGGMNGIKYRTTEAIWTNVPSSYNVKQQTLFAA